MLERSALQMKQFKFRSSIAVTMLLALIVPILAACGGAQPSTPGGEAATAAPAAAATAAPAAAEPTAGAPAAAAPTAAGAAAEPTAATGAAAEPTAATGAAGGQPGTGPADEANLAPPEQQILRVPLLADPESIDPAQDQDTGEETVIKQLFTGLTQMSADLKPEPAIADSWEFNADNTQITFKLKDTKWSDGQPLTAKDFEYSWKRFIDPTTASPYVSLVTGVIKGATELNSAAVPTDTAKLPELMDAVGVKAIDDKTLQVTFEQPAPYFTSIAALGNMAPVRKDVVDKFADKWTEVGNLIGNGPFILKAWTKGSEITLAPNPNYYGGAPKLQTLSFKIIADDPTTFANYQSDELDISSVPPAEIPGVRANDQFKDQVVEQPALATYYFPFNVKVPPFDNVKVRQAFAAAIDRQTLVDQVLNGVPTVAYSLIPPGMPGHLSEEEAGDSAQKFDPAKAKQLLSEAGFSDPSTFPEVKLAFANASSHQLIAERIQADLQTNLGIKVTLDPREPKTYFNDVRKNTPGFFRSGWSADYPDPYDWDRLVFGPGSEQNYGKWENADFTKLLDQADKATTPEDREKAYKEAEKVLAKDAGAVFVYWYGTFRLVKPWVKGLTYTSQDPTIGAYHYKDAQILNH
jgi:oligopeptide transport system substrate-binding protein